jgi:collagenase-like PrtC family protease
LVRLLIFFIFEEMPMQFSLPYNNDPETLAGIFALRNFGGSKISELYLSGPQEYSGSGRIVSSINVSDFVKTIDAIHEQGIGVNLVINTVCDGAKWYARDTVEKLVEFLKKMHKEHGIATVTVANPVYMAEIKQRLPEFEICASVLSDIDCVERAVVAKQAGADVITPDANINRNLQLLKDIKKATGLKLKIMVNEGCLYKCLYRKFHFNYVSHCSREISTRLPQMKDFFAHCLSVTNNDYSQILKSGWIRPEDLKCYAEITDYFKIVGRTRPKSMVLRAVRAYMEQRYTGNIFDLLCSSLNAFGMSYGAYLDNSDLEKAGFFEQVSTCNQLCKSCDYCGQLARRSLKLKVVTREKLEDMGKSRLADELESKGKLPFFG